jgi:hypothetical protein
MKKILLSLALLHGIAAYSQNTNFGTSSGTLGTNNSNFGYFAGNAATATSANNAFFGTSSGRFTTTGQKNTAIGSEALYSNSNGLSNTALGYRTLFANTSGSLNVASGVNALRSNTTGSFNTAVGSEALTLNTVSTDNSAFGYGALNKGTGSFNTAVGSFALFNSTTGTSSVAVGYRALYSTTVNGGNVAVGGAALEFCNGGQANVAMGNAGLKANTTGSFNSTLGHFAMNKNTTGSNNTALGLFAFSENLTGTWNTVIGAQAGTTSATPNLTNSMALGASAQITASNQVRIGNPSTTSIGGQVSWSTLSDGRFKKDLREDVSGLDFINKLRPVSYVVDKKAVDKFRGIPDSITQQFHQSKSAPIRETGFVAQEVEALVKKTGYVFSGVEAPQNEHDHYSIRYAEFVVPLVKAVQELTGKLEDQEKKSDLQHAEIIELKQKLGVYEGSKSEGNSDNLQLALFQNNPNPFSVNTEIKMTLPETTKQATLIVYNLEGKQLKDIVVQERGNTKAVISASELAAGMYLYALIADGKVIDTKRLILTK